MDQHDHAQWLGRQRRLALALAAVVLLSASGLIGQWVSSAPVVRERVEASPTGYRIDVNRADAATLTLLPGIGEALGPRIVEYRREHGAFERVRDLEQVSGIGPGRRAQAEPWVVVGEP